MTIGLFRYTAISHITIALHSAKMPGRKRVYHLHTRFSLLIAHAVLGLRGVRGRMICALVCRVSVAYR